MEIFELSDKLGEIKKYQGFNIKPEVDNLGRIKYIPKKTDPLYTNFFHRFEKLSMEKVYKIYRIVNVNQIIIRDDMDESVLLTPSFYQVIEELTDKELVLLKERREMLKVIDKMIKSKVKI